MNFRTPLTLFLIALILGGCASVRPSTVAPATALEREPVGEMRPADATPGQKLVQIAAGFIGTPYKFGGDDPRGFDCSGLVVYSFDRLGVEVPRTAADQRRAAQRVKCNALTPGDLLFFRTKTRAVDHVGIYAGAGRFIHAPRSGHVVTYAYLDDPYYESHFVSAGRFE